MNVKKLIRFAKSTQAYAFGDGFVIIIHWEVEIDVLKKCFVASPQDHFILDFLSIWFAICQGECSDGATTSIESMVMTRSAHRSCESNFGAVVKMRGIHTC